jgi:hypothetical protein
MIRVVWGTARNGAGNIIQGGNVTCYIHGSATPSTIYTDLACTLPTTSVTSDALDGSFMFFVNDDGTVVYDVQVTGTGLVPKLYQYVVPTPTNGNLPISGWASSFGFATFQAAHAAAVLEGRGLLVCTNLPFTATSTYNATASIWVVTGGSITQMGSSILAINGPFRSDGQAFSGFSAGQVTGLKEAYPEWWGAKNNATGTTGDVDAGGAVNLAISSLVSGGTLKMVGSYRIDTNILPASNMTLDLSAATVYLGTLGSPEYVIYCNGISHVRIKPGRFLSASYSATTTAATGTYYYGAPVGMWNGCDDIQVAPGGQVFGYSGVTDVYNSNHVVVNDWYAYNCNGGVQAVATTQHMYDINFINLHLIGCGDDAISFLLNGTAFNMYNCRATGSFVDKTRFTSPHQNSATGLRVGCYGVSGKFIGGILSENRFFNVSDFSLYLTDVDSSTIHHNLTDGFGAGNGASAYVFGTEDAHQVTNSTITDNDAINPIGNNNKGTECGGLANCTIRGGLQDVGANGDTAIINVYNTSTGNVLEGIRLKSTTSGNTGVVASGAATNNTVRNNSMTLVAGEILTSLVAGNLAYGNKGTSGPIMAVATLVAGAVIVSTIEILSTDTVRITRYAAGGVMGNLYVYQIVAGTSIEIRSDNIADTSTVLWEIIH